MTQRSLSYSLAGVSFDRAREALQRIRDRTQTLRTETVLHLPQAFCGLCVLPVKQSFDDPMFVVVSSLAHGHHGQTSRADGEQLMQRCLERMTAIGGKPLGLLDAIAAHTLSPDVVDEFLEGVVRVLQARQEPLPVLGGELAEMPRVLRPRSWLFEIVLFGLAERAAVPKQFIFDRESAQPVFLRGSTVVAALPITDLLADLQEPVLAVTVDGVGSKGFLAGARLGADVVHHGVNDLAVHGVRPIAVLPSLVAGTSATLASHRRSEEIRHACAHASASPLVTLPGHQVVDGGAIAPRVAHLSATTIGLVDRAQIIVGQEGISVGDHVFCLASSGLHTNGTTLAIQAFESKSLLQMPMGELGGQTPAGVLAQPHRSYAALILRLLAEGWPITGLAHITGGGLEENIRRILPANCTVQFPMPPRPALFRLIQRYGAVREAEMRQVFNLGVGLVGTVRGPEASFQALCSRIRKQGHTIVSVGRVVSGGRGVRYSHPRS